MKSVFVTGATGFIGKHLMDYLNNEEFNIYYLTRKPNTFINPKFHSVIGDLANLNDIKFPFSSIDILVNLAGEINDDNLMFKTNVIGVCNLIQFIDFYNVKIVHHLSSVGVIGASFSCSFNEYNEDSVLIPKNYYERSKLLSEEIFINCCKIRSIPLFIYRPTNVFGESHKKETLLGFFKLIKRTKFFPCFTETSFNYVYVKDLVSFIFENFEFSGNLKIVIVGYSCSSVFFIKTIQDILKVENKIFVFPKFFSKIFCLVIKIFFKFIPGRISTMLNATTFNSNYYKAKKDSIVIGLKNTINFYKFEGKL